MGEFRLAGAYVEATMNRTKLDADIAKLEKQDIKVDVKADFDATAASARIDALVAARRIDVEVDLDAKVAIASLDKLTKSRAIQITADLATRVAAADLALLTKARTMRVTADADTRVAAEEIRLLTSNRTIHVNIQVDEAALAALTGQSYDVDLVPEVNDAAYQRAEKKLDKLTADRQIRILASAETRVAADEIRNLTRRQRVRIGIDVDTRVAANDIANLTRRRMMRVQAQADTTAANASLTHLTRDRRVNIRTSMLGLGSLGSLGSSMGSAGSSAGMLSSRLIAIASAALLALPAVASLGQAIIQMGPAAAIAAPALGSLITMGAALGVGLHGVGTAFKSAFETGASSATSAASATRALESAQINVARSARALKEAQVDAARQIADAQDRVKGAARDVRDAELAAAEARIRAAREVADAQKSLKNTIADVAAANKRAAESVAQAEEDLADAQKDARRAQLDLTQARKDAADQLEDLANKVIDSELDHREAVLRVADAQADLQKVMADPKATQRQRDEAQLTFDQAVQQLREQELAEERVKEEAAAAAKAGVEGSDAVTKAKENLGNAEEKAADQAKALRDAAAAQIATQLEGAASVAKAARDVADAQAAAAKAGVDGARQVADAQEALRAAQQGVADAQVAGSRQVRSAQEALADAQRAVAAAMAQGSTEATKFNDAMAKLSPNARSFVEAVQGIAPAWSAVRVDVQDALFQGLGTTLTRMSTAVLPAVRDGLVGMGGVLNTMGRELMNTFTRLGNAGTLAAMFTGFTNGMKPLAKVPGQIAQAFVQLGVAASPAFAKLTTAAGAAATRISDKLSKAFASGGLEDAINQAIDIAKQFGHLIGDIFGTLGNIMKAAAAGGGDALGGLGAVFAELRRITSMPEVQKMLTTIFTALNAIAKLIAGTLGAVIMAVLPLLAALAPTITTLANVLGPVLAQLAAALGKALMPIIQALLPVVAMVASALIKVVTAIIPLLGPVGALIGAIVTALAPVLGVVLDVIVMLVRALVGPLITVINALIPIVGVFGKLIGQLAPVTMPLIAAILTLLPPLAELAVSLLGLAMQVLTPLMPLIVILAQMLTGLLAGALGNLIPILTLVITWIQKFVDAMTAGVKWVVDKFTHLYDVLVGHSIIPDLVKAIVGWFKKLWDQTKALFTSIKNGIVDAWNATWSKVRSIWNSFWSGLWGALNSAWSSLRNSVTSLRTSVSNTWSAMWNGIRDKASSIFSTLRTKVNEFKSGVTSAFTNLRNSLGTIWNGIKSKLSSPVKWVVGHVYNDGIRKMWNTIASKISSKITLPGISLGFAKGGIVPGTGTGDTVPAMLTPKERVLSLAQVDQLGGHRAIDAMLGKNVIEGRTGGNPSRKQEQKRAHYADGGIVGAISGIGGAISGGLSWAKDLVIGGLKSAAQKAISSMVRPLINSMPGAGPVKSLMQGIPTKALDGMLAFLGKEDKKAAGGPGVQKGLAWARTQNGKAYQWGGNGNPSWDCSGFMSAIESVIRGENPHRRWATGSFAGANAAPGWVRGLNSPFMIGITNAGVGHTAGTIGKVNVESRGGGGGVIVGPRARGYNDALFTDRYGFQPATKYDQGGLLQPGRTLVDNKTGKPEAVLTPAERAMFEQIVRGGAGDTIQVDVQVQTMTVPSQAEMKRFAVAIADPMKEAIRKLDRSRNR